MTDRRELLTAMAALGSLADAAGAAEASPESIYIPSAQREEDRAYILDFLETFSFAMVITAHGGLHVTNVPTTLDRTAGPWGTLWWHIARGNQQNEALDHEALVVFHGPHGYISPNWYTAGRNSVPTWNFAVVHCAGRPVRQTSDEAFAQNLARLVAKNEKAYGGDGRWDFSKLPEPYLHGMRQGIVGYEMKIERVEAKFKLGQERSAADRDSVLAALRAGRSSEPSFAELTARHYRHHPKT